SSERGRIKTRMCRGACNVDPGNGHFCLPCVSRNASFAYILRAETAGSRHSYLKFLPRLQPRNVMRGMATGLRDGVEVAEFFDDELRLGWLGVRDVDGARFAGLQLRQLLRQGVGSQVQAALRQGAFGVAERGFDDQH